MKSFETKREFSNLKNYKTFSFKIQIGVDTTQVLSVYLVLGLIYTNRVLDLFHYLLLINNLQVFDN